MQVRQSKYGELGTTGEVVVDQDPWLRAACNGDIICYRKSYKSIDLVKRAPNHVGDHPLRGNLLLNLSMIFLIKLAGYICPLIGKCCGGLRVQLEDHYFFGW